MSTTKTETRPHTFAQPILLVEDNPEDYEVTRRAFEQLHVANPLFHCRDGDEALDYLFRRGEYAEKPAPRPGVILLDLNMPGTDGRDVLRAVKMDSMLRKIPVIILTTSNHERDIEECYDAGANSYIEKPVGLDKFLESLERLRDYWFEISILPRV